MSGLLTLNLPNSPAIMVSVDIEGKSLGMEVDKGAAVSVIADQVYRQKFSHVKL